MNTFENQQSTVPLRKLGKFSASLLMARESWRLLMKDKEVLLFPIMTALTFVTLIAIFAVVAWLLVGPEYISKFFISSEAEMNATVSEIPTYFYYGFIFILYLISYFIFTFFSVGLTAVVYERIKGGDLTFGGGIKVSSRIVGKIFIWSLISATVGVVLGAIAERSKWLGKIVVYFLGTAWNILTFFIAPTLLLDEVSVSKSIKNSGLIFKKTWGETLITGFSLGLFFGLLILGVFVTFGLLTTGAIVLGVGMALVVLLGVLFVLALVAIIVVSSTLNAIFRVVLYEYARNGIVASGFTPELIMGAIKQEKKKEASLVEGV